MKGKNYGSISYRADGKTKHVSVHKLAYELVVGDVPPGLQLDHLCCNKVCVNPTHLEPVTAKENRRRAVAHKRLVSDMR
jgi:hypothetical protein